jgi:ubiquinone/menaquinone biosynthesis C-methylase UbiE
MRANMIKDYSQNFNKFHLGCGIIFLKNYLNIGYWTNLEQNKLYEHPNGVQDTVLLNFDLTNGIPASDNSLDVVYHSHMLEHLTNTEGIQFLKECNRVLKPGAFMRLLVPDLGAFSKKYIEKDDFFFDAYRKEALANDIVLYPTRGAVFMGMLHNHGHKMGYDFETICHILNQIGFTDIRKTMFQESQLSDIKDIEPYAPLRAAESLCVECVKK